MTITREQVADLRPGDVVELRDSDWPDDNLVRGTVHFSPLEGVTEDLCVGPQILRRGFDGGTPQPSSRSLTVISRAPRPLYVNHPRTEAVCGDVACEEDRPAHEHWRSFGYSGSDVWYLTGGTTKYERAELPARLRLLVDGETGEVVQ